MSTAEIAEMILALEAPHPLRIGIDGFCAAGKTTLANAVAERLEVKERRVIRASADNFQNPPEVRWQMGPQSPEGFFRHAIDFQALRSETRQLTKLDQNPGIPDTLDDILIRDPDV
jgi:uridine kinase